ncbi:hypothetical protein FACS1894172_16140 [Spirochaetia bacterium]|nr:hypothetical protein FACS1894172_16140 [Spirochaetia bacterium]
MPRIAIPDEKIVSVSLDQIEARDNIRKEYKEQYIEELAASIKEVGLLQPVLVKTIEGKGLPRYELVAGFCRYKAFKYLRDEKDEDPGPIDAIIVEKDRLVIQLIENLQRSDLSPRELEHGIHRLVEDSGMTQTEVAKRLGKTQEYISYCITAYRVRSAAELDVEGVPREDLDSISTRALAALGPVISRDISDAPRLVRMLIYRGGSVRAAQELAAAQKNRVPEIDPEPSYRDESSTAPGDDSDSNPGEIFTRKFSQQEEEPADEDDQPERVRTPEKPKQNVEKEDCSDPFKMVRLNDVELIIQKYISELAKRTFPDMNPWEAMETAANEIHARLLTAFTV